VGLSGSYEIGDFQIARQTHHTAPRAALALRHNAKPIP
jgi:hypothetical protein